MRRNLTPDDANSSSFYLLSEIKKNTDMNNAIYRGAGKSLARPGRKQDTATGDFDVHISYL